MEAQNATTDTPTQKNDLYAHLGDELTNDNTEEYPYRTGLGRGMCRAKYRIEAVVEKHE